MQYRKADRARRRHSVVRELWVFIALAFILPASIAHAEDLDHLVQLLLEKNPAILAARRSVDARKAMVTSARTLPDPSVTFETMGNLLPPTVMAGDPSSARVLTFSQEIPFPGKLNLLGQIASAEADAEAWKYEEVRRETIAELKMAYYDLYLAQKLTDVVEKSKDLLTQFAEISEARYKVGEGAQQDVIKSQVEISRLLDRLATLQREKNAALARINTLLYRAPDTPIDRVPDIPKPRFAWSLEDLYRKASDNNPLVRMNRKEIDRGELSVALAKKSFYPDFEVGFSYYNRRDLPEMYGLMFKAKIPLYFWRKQRPELESATASLLGQRRQYDNTLSTLYFSLKDPYLKTSTDANLLELYGGAIVPQATLALESSISSYRVGKVDFLSLLSNQQTVLEYEMKYYEVLADYYKALVTLESLTGEVLTP
ncbi:MAG TPA: TolC family protein [Acidobacteriota bacterium]|nr:TolC family protein [Acidobacteriota bacterium]